MFEERESIFDKQYVVRFLETVHQQHQSQINQLINEIDTLEEDKQFLLLKVEQLKLKITKKQETIKRLQETNTQLHKQLQKQLRYRKEIQKQMENKQKEQKQLKISTNLNQSPQALAKMIVDLRKYFNIIPQSIISVKEEQKQKSMGNFRFFIWGKDKESLEKYENASIALIVTLLKKNQKVIQSFFIDCNQPNAGQIESKARESVKREKMLKERDA